MAKLFFKLEYTVRELRIPQEVVLPFEYDGSHEIKVVLRAPTDEEQAVGHSISHAFCTASLAIEPNEKVREVFEKIAANQIIQDGSDAVQVSIEYSTPDGTRVRLPTLSSFPEYFRSFMKSVNSELADIARRTISVLRWRANENGLHNPISSRGLFWSIDGDFWHHAPTNYGVRVSFAEQLHSSEQLRTEVENIVRSGRGAPLHDDLFREAWNQRYENPRSALVIGIAAAEIAVKHCISTLVPDAEWLATNLPTPPVVRMLTEYLPKLPAHNKLNGQVKPPPASVLDSLKKGITIRNQLSHAGTVNPTGDDVTEILEAVHDLLWLVDFYSGSEWALGFLRPETRNQLVVA